MIKLRKPIPQLVPILKQKNQNPIPRCAMAGFIPRTHALQEIDVVRVHKACIC
jgi:hypothetical protein